MLGLFMVNNDRDGSLRPRGLTNVGSNDIRIDQSLSVLPIQDASSHFIIGAISFHVTCT